MELRWVSAAFRGIQSCVIFLILSAGIKMLKKLNKSAINMTVFGAVLACMILFSLFSVSFSSIFYILISAAIGVFVYSLSLIKGKGKNAESGEDKI
jgi:chromate transporter